MLRVTHLVIRTGLLAVSLSISAFAAAAPNADQQFEKFAARYVERYLASHPEAATQLGDHRFDRRGNDLSVKGFAADVKLFRETLKALDGFPVAQLSPPQHVDYRILRADLENNLLTLETIKDFEWDPLLYNPANGIYLLLARDFAPLAARLNAVNARLGAVPGRLAAAKANLKIPPRIFTETAIQQNEDAVSLLKNALDFHLQSAPAMQSKLAVTRARAITALEAHGKWLKDDLLPRSTRDPRMGVANYAKRLRTRWNPTSRPQTCCGLRNPIYLRPRRRWLKPRCHCIDRCLPTKCRLIVKR